MHTNGKRTGALLFQTDSKASTSRTAFQLVELIFHWTVRDLTKSNRNPIIGLGKEMMQSMVFIGVFYMMYALIGMRGAAVRGDFLLYLMSGIFLFMTHTKAMGAVVGSEGPTGQMMKHAPMNTTVAIVSAALSALYIQTLSVMVILFGYHALTGNVQIDQPVGALGMFLLSWFTGASIGMVLLGLRPFFPGLTNILSTIYQRANMVFSGKMFVVNSLPAFMLAIFDWNPLFHLIDQCRGFVFIHYNPHFTSVTYPIKIAVAALIVGLMGEFYARKNASLSMGAAR